MNFFYSYMIHSYVTLRCASFVLRIFVNRQVGLNIRRQLCLAGDEGAVRGPDLGLHGMTLWCDGRASGGSMSERTYERRVLEPHADHLAA
jgi:hypothetical protein